MTEAQAAEIIDYLDALNQLMVRTTNFTMFIAIVAALAGGIYIGRKWGN